jgi:hypothetical protein
VTNVGLSGSTYVSPTFGIIAKPPNKQNVKNVFVQFILVRITLKFTRF